jgi:hypothetical protein
MPYGAASVPIENALFHRHAGERERGRNVRRGTWAWLYLNKGSLSRDWSKPGEALLEEFDFRRCHLFVHFLLLFASSRFDFGPSVTKETDDPAII